MMLSNQICFQMEIDVRNEVPVYSNSQVSYDAVWILLLEMLPCPACNWDADWILILRCWMIPVQVMLSGSCPVLSAPVKMSSSSLYLCQLIVR